jgi:hypothetical protein
VAILREESGQEGRNVLARILSSGEMVDAWESFQSDLGSILCCKVPKRPSLLQPKRRRNIESGAMAVEDEQDSCRRGSGCLSRPAACPAGPLLMARSLNDFLVPIWVRGQTGTDGASEAARCRSGRSERLGGRRGNRGA